MTERETIEIAIHCLNVQAEREVCEECPVYAEGGIACREVARTAISALKEIRLYKDNGLCLIPEDVYSRQCCELDAYKELGTVEECREAAEKQKPKNPETYTETVQTVTGCFEVDVFECPVCGSYVCNVGDELPNYCDNCGQALGESEGE